MSRKDEITKFKKKDYYKNVIEPKILELKKICNDEKIPMFVAVAVSNNEKKTEYEYDFIGTNSNEIFLKDDKITDFFNVVLGFDVVPPKKIVNIDYDIEEVTPTAEPEDFEEDEDDEEDSDEE